MKVVSSHGRLILLFMHTTQRAQQHSFHLRSKVFLGILKEQRVSMAVDSTKFPRTGPGS